eukprot:TCONS_00064451-protein
MTFKNNISRSHCSYCQCSAGNNVSCYKFDINKNRTTVCQNCQKIPFVISCSYCSNPFYSKDLSNASKVETGESIKVPSLECVKCQCSRSGNFGCNYINKDRCYDVSACSLMFDRLRNGTSRAKYVCSNCLFDGQPKSPYSTWMVLIHGLNISCSCGHTGDVSCKSTKPMFIGGIEIARTCRNCSNSETLNEEFRNRGCSIRGVNLTHNSCQFISKDSTYHCFQCACYMGQLKCLLPQRWGTRMYPCVGRECLEIYGDPWTSNRCSNPVEWNRCPRGHSFNWTTEFCNITCNNGKKSYTELKERWCAPLGMPEPCQQCPDRRKFFVKYKDLVQRCRDSLQYTWKDQICDTREDCPDGSDEENCEKYNCRYNEDRNGIVWPPTEVNTVAYLPCNRVEKGPDFQGELSRKCVFSKQNQTIWGSTTFCECNRSNVPKFVKPASMVCNITTLDHLLNSMKALQNHGNGSPHLRSHVMEAEKILQTMFDLCKDEVPENGHSLRNTEQSGTEDSSPANRSSTKKPVLKRPFLFINVGAGIYSKQYKSILQAAYSLLAIQVPCKERASQSFWWIFGNATKHFKVDSLLTPYSHAVSLGSKRNWFGVSELQMQETFQSMILSNNGSLPVMLVPQKKLIRGIPVRSNLDRLEEILSGISIAFLALGLLAFQMIRKKTMKIRIHQNLLLVFLLSFLVLKIPLWFVPALPEKSTAGCFVVSLSSYFFTLCTLSWMMVEGINIVILVVFVFQHHKNKLFKLYLLIGYGFPLVLTALFGSIFTNSFQNADFCTALGGDHIWLLKGPLTLMLVINVILLLMIISAISKASKRSKSWKNTKRTSSSMKTFLVLVPLLGLPFILAPFVEYNKYIAYAFVLMNSLSGFYLFIGHVLMDPAIKDQISRQTRRFGGQSLSGADKTDSTNHKQ